MDKKKISIKNLKGPKSSYILIKKDALDNIEEFEIPFEAACSPEFAEGCILREDD